ncbi:hypothetical protein C8Q79DRAFT_1008662 [Trametes meyenii]|nr:hypothetical protein C8Q79DRAFT_1008662 [Trametes meyenii]
MPDIPYDIICAILGYLRGDRNTGTLRSCSLVSRDWCAASRASLFDTVTVVCRSNPQDASEITEFARLITTSSTQFGRHMRHLRLVCSRNGQDFVDSLWRSCAVSVQTLHSILPLLSSLRSLVLWNVRLVGGTATLLIPHSHKRPQLDELEVQAVVHRVEDTITPLLSLIAAFSSIHVLNLSLEAWGPASHRADVLAPTPKEPQFIDQVRIDVLVLRSLIPPWTSALQNAVRKMQPPGHSLLSVGICPSGARTNGFVGIDEYLSLEQPECVQIRPGPNLKRPWYVVEHDVRGSLFFSVDKHAWSAIGLKNQSAVKTLVISLECEAYEGEARQFLFLLVLEACAEILAPGTVPPKLEILVLRVSLRSRDDPFLNFETMWEDIDAAIIRLGSLRAVVIDFAYGSHCDPRPFEEELLRMTHSKGILTTRTNTRKVPWFDITS